MTIVIIIDGVKYDTKKIDTKDMITSKHYIFYGINWYELIKSNA